MKKVEVILLISLTIMFISSFIVAQERWIIRSAYLSSPDTVLVFKPDNYQPINPYPLVYLLHGYSQNYRQWPNITDCQQLANNYNMVIVCPDGFVSWYVDSPYEKRSRMESFFFNELVPTVHQKINVNRKNIFISGLSMGGYGALRYFLLHPDYFNTAGCTSGGVDIDFNILEKASLGFFTSRRMINDLTHLLGSSNQNDWHQYSIVRLLKKGKGKRKPFIFDCGMEDIFYLSNTELKETCDALQLPVTFLSQPGNHDAAYWKNSIQQHFLYFETHHVK